MAYDSYSPTADFFEDDLALDDDVSDDLFDSDEAWQIDEDEDLEELEDLSDEDYDMLEMSSSDTVGLYLKEMARVPLLNTEEEINLAMRLEAGKDAARKLRSNPEHIRALDWQNMIQDGVSARDHLIKANTRLVVSIAKKYMTREFHSSISFKRAISA